jgi:hypothetical protein
MTLLPSDEFGIKGHPGPAYDVGETCWAPGCNRPAIHAHHMWPRSFLRNQPYEWVQLPDGTIVGNRAGMCFEHHDDCSSPVGGHRARIVFASGVFYWEERRHLAATDDSFSFDPPHVMWVRVGPLDPQPPGAAEYKVKPVVTEVCPTCGHSKRKPATKPTAARKTSDWTLKVPADAEIGAEVLDGWADDIAVLLGFEDETSRLRRYHAVATGLAWVIQNRDEFVRDLVAAAS